jgi:hypothetical protein
MVTVSEMPEFPGLGRNGLDEINGAQILARSTKEASKEPRKTRNHQAQSPVLFDSKLPSLASFAASPLCLSWLQCPRPNRNSFLPQPRSCTLQATTAWRCGADTTEYHQRLPAMPWFDSRSAPARRFPSGPRHARRISHPRAESRRSTI